MSFGIAAADDAEGPTSEVLWYSLFWGPWFILGGALFMLAAVSRLRRSPDRRAGVAGGVLGACGGLVAAAAPFAISAIA